jgi:hypothetical protein
MCHRMWSLHWLSCRAGSDAWCLLGEVQWVRPQFGGTSGSVNQSLVPCAGGWNSKREWLRKQRMWKLWKRQWTVRFEVPWVGRKWEIWKFGCDWAHMACACCGRLLHRVSTGRIATVHCDVGCDIATCGNVHYLVETTGTVLNTQHWPL